MKFIGKFWRRGVYISVFFLAIAAYLLLNSPQNAVASGEAAAAPLAQIGINPNDQNSSGVFIGIKDLKDAQGNTILNDNITGYQIEITRDHNLVKVLDVVDEAKLGNITINNDANSDLTSIANASSSGTTAYSKLVFVPLALIGTVNDSPTVTIHFKSLTDSNWNHIVVPDALLTFQRGKIANAASPGTPDALDAVAGLQYLSNMADAGLDQGKVNVVNMASINPLNDGATTVNPSIKGVVSLLQYLVGLRDDSFQSVKGLPAQISIAPNTVDSTTPAAITVTGTNTHFAKDVTKLRILNSNNQDVTGASTVNVQTNAKALLNLAPSLGAGTYTVELTTDTEVLKAQLTVVYPGLSFALSAISPISFKVTFNHSLDDISQITFDVNNLGTSVPVKATWNTSRTEAILTSLSNFPQGTYTVTIKDGAADLGAGSVESEKIAQIKITSTKLGVTQGYGGSQTGYATYVVLDQYGNDITSSSIANNLLFQCGVGTVTARNGFLTICPNVTNLNMFNEVVVTAYDPTTGISATSSLTTSQAMGTLSDITLNNLTNSDNKDLIAGDVSSTWYIDYTATDVSGNPTQNYDMVKNGLILQMGSDGSANQLSTSNPYVKAAVIEDPNNSSKALIQVTLTGDTVIEDTPVSITAMTWSGKTSTLKVILKKQPTLDTFTLRAPTGDISVGETEEIPFEALDQYGTPITNYSDLSSRVAFSSNNPIQLQQNPDGSAKLIAGPFTVSGLQTISAMTISGKTSSITLTVHSNEVNKITIDSSTLSYTSDSSGIVHGYALYKIVDQYGNDITPTYPVNNLRFQSDAGSIAAQQGVLTLTPMAGVNLQTIPKVTINVSDTATATSANAALSPAAGTLKDLKLNDLTNADNKVLTAGDSSTTWYIDYTATDLNGNPTKDYNLVMNGILEQNGELTTSSPFLKAQVVHDPSDPSQAAIQVTVANNQITEDLPITISAVTCTGKIISLDVTLKKQSTVESITLMPLAYEIAVGETKELPFTAYDQNGVQITKYSDLAGQISLSNAILTEDANGTAKLLVGPFYVDGQQVITAMTAAGKTSTLTLTIQKAAHAYSLAIDSSVLVSAMQTGSVQYIDCGYDHGGLTVKDQYGREIDMTNNPGTYRIQATALGSVTVKSTNDQTSLNPAAFAKNGLRIEATTPGTGSVIFQLVDTLNPNILIDSKTVTFTVLPNSAIKGYTLEPVTSPIYAGCTTGSAITDQQIAYEANPHVYGVNSSGSKVLLAGSPIIGVSVDNTRDFRIDDFRGPISSENPMACDEIFVAANTLPNNMTTSSAILTVTILGVDGITHSLTTPIYSSMETPAATSLNTFVDTSIPGLDVSGDGGVVIVSVASIPACGLVTGNYVTKYDELGSGQHRSRVYFYALDQYGTKAMPIAQVVQVGSTKGFSIDTQGMITCSPEDITAGSSAILTAKTNNGLEKTIEIRFV